MLYLRHTYGEDFPLAGKLPLVRRASVDRLDVPAGQCRVLAIDLGDLSRPGTPAVIVSEFNPATLRGLCFWEDCEWQFAYHGRAVEWGRPDRNNNIYPSRHDHRLVLYRDDEELLRLRELLGCRL